MLGTQLIRRNDELALLYEKIKLQFSRLQTGEVAFKNLEDEIRNLRIHHKATRRESERNKQKGNTVDGIKRKIYTVQRELLHERTKVKALSEELENPMNLQRWRKLGGADPAIGELILKVGVVCDQVLIRCPHFWIFVGVCVGGDLEIV